MTVTVLEYNLSHRIDDNPYEAIVDLFQSADPSDLNLRSNLTALPELKDLYKSGPARKSRKGETTLRNIQMNLKNIQMNLRNIQINLRNIQINLKNIQMNLRNIQINLRNIQMNLKNIQINQESILSQMYQFYYIIILVEELVN